MFHFWVCIGRADNCGKEILYERRVRENSIMTESNIEM